MRTAKLDMKKKHVYVVIMCEKPRFITSVDCNTRTAEWKATEKPYEFHSFDDAWYVCLGLMWRGQYAFPVVTGDGYEQTTPFYREEAENG